MMTINEMLAHYNSIAPTPLRVWKDSKAKLEERIAKLDPAIKTVPTDRVPATVVAEKVFANVEAKPEAKPAKAAKASGGVVKSGVPQFCQEQGINPKLARAALRKANFHAPYTLNQKTRDITPQGAKSGEVATEQGS